jgi:ribosomal protein S27E
MGFFIGRGIIMRHSENIKCMACDDTIETIYGHPYFQYKKIITCTQCALNMVEPLYCTPSGGLMHIIFKEMLSHPFGRKKRTTIKNYKKIFKDLLHKYKFQCNFCGEKEEKKLTIDHIKPVSKGGTDDLNNLQILCRSCNSKKGAKYEVSEN